MGIEDVGFEGEEKDWEVLEEDCLQGRFCFLHPFSRSTPEVSRVGAALSLSMSL